MRLLQLGLTLALLTAAAAAPAAAAPNTLTAAEKKAGWKLLFDGKSTAGWRGFNRPAFPEGGWTVVDGTLARVRDGKQGGGGDLVTVDEYGSYELRLEYRISPKGNSGIKYLVDESLVKNGGHAGLGFELQLEDDEHGGGGQADKHSTGALYDLIAPAAGPRVNPPGEWNEVRLVVGGSHVEHWVNGVKTVEYERGSPKLKELIAVSKYKSIPGFGERPRGRILLQDHPGEVAFRNIKLRPLPAESASGSTSR